MKRMMITLFAIGIAAMSSMSMAAMSTSKVRTETRFLTDKMAYELNLTTAQYNDVYEINYDFVYSIRYLMDDVMRGEGWAMDRYYYLLDIRNDDLRWVLNNYQYNRFLGVDYFYRPVYASDNRWQFRIYLTYNNHNHYYFPKPYHYKSYTGGHYRTHHNNVSYYKGRYNHKVHSTPVRISNNKTYTNTRRSDFSSVTIRPNSNTAPKKVKDDVYSTSRRSSNSSVRTSTTNKNNSSSTTAPNNSSSRRSPSTSSDNTKTVKPSTSTSNKSTTTSPSSNSSSSSRRSTSVSGSSSVSKPSTSSDSNSSGSRSSVSRSSSKDSKSSVSNSSSSSSRRSSSSSSSSRSGGSRR